MRTETFPGHSSRNHAFAGGDVTSQPAPGHVDTLHWQLADATERHRLLGPGAQAPAAEAPASNTSAAPAASGLLRAPLAAGVFQDLRYPVPTPIPDAAGKPSRFDLTFRDRSGFPKPTSHAYLNRTSPAPGNSWKGLRLDHGPNPTIGGASNWHWNHKGAGGFGIPDHTAATRFESGVGRTLQVARPLGRAAVVVGVALDAVSLGRQIQASRQTGDWSNTAQEGARIAGGWAGAVVGAKAAGSLGAAIGTMIAPGIGTIIGGAVGGLVGGAAGYLAGSSLGSAVAGWFR